MTKGFYWHVHHNQLFEWCFDEQERRERIRLNKPEDEIETRLRLMKPIIGSIPPPIIEARKAHDKARKAYDKAGQAYDRAWFAYVNVQQAYDRAWFAYVNAQALCASEVIALHAQECPGCPWDGKTIFPTSRND